MTLPDSIRAAIEEVVARSQLDPSAAYQVRRDLEEYFVDGLEAGRTPEELLDRFGSLDAAAKQLASGPVPSGETMHSRGWSALLASTLSDLRFGCRALIRNPGLTLTSTVVLALGIGATAVVVAVVNEILLRPLAVAEPSELVDIWADIEGGNSFAGFSYLDFADYRDENTVLQSLAAFAGTQLEVGEPGSTESAVVQLVSPEYFPMLGLQPQLGRMAFEPDASFGEAPTVVLTDAFWRSSFGADPDVVGRPIQLETATGTIIGVGPPGFGGHFIGFPSDLWVPITSAPAVIQGFDPADRSQKRFEMIGRREAGVAPAAIESAFQVLAGELASRYPDTNRGHGVGVTPTTGLDHSLRGITLVFLAILSVVSGLVLVIACLNVGSLILVRTMSRDREMAVRLAIGAGTRRLIRQITTESVLLVGLGAVAGTVVAWQLTSLLSETVARVGTGLGLELSMDWRVLGLTAVVALVAGLCASAAPAFYLLGKQPASALRARGGTERGGTRLRSTLVVGQVAASVLLLITTGLFVRALATGTSIDPGYAADEIATFGISLSDEGMDPASGEALKNQIVDAVGGLPDVRAVTTANLGIPSVARTPMPIEVAGVQPPPGQERLVADHRVVGAAFFETVGTRLLAGRDFTEADERDGPRVAVVSEEFARRYWSGLDVIGRSFTAGSDIVRVVGVAQDVRYVVQDPSPDPLIYLSAAGRPTSQLQVTVRAASPLALAEELQGIVGAAIPGHSSLQYRSARQSLDQALFPQRMGALVIGAMGITALLLAMVGLYGLIQYTVSRDQHELGVRLALGGRRSDLVSVVVRRGLSIVGAGVALGVVIAVLVTPGLTPFLSGVGARDPQTYIAVIGGFGAAALAASFVPALRASRIQPIEALRGE